MEPIDENKLNEIIQHIKTHDPKFQDPKYWLNYESGLALILKYYWYEKLNWCGCGCPDAAMRVIANYLEVASIRDLEASKKKHEEYFGGSEYDDDLYLCLMYSLDAAGFTEHGSSIYSAWPEKDGEYFLWAIREADKRDELDLHA